MSIKEYRFLLGKVIPPEIVDVGRYVEAHLSEAEPRMLPAGWSDLTPPLSTWRKPTHLFHITVLHDGTGFLKLIATGLDSAIMDVGSPFADVHALDHMLNVPHARTILGGYRYVGIGKKERAAFSVLEYIPDAPVIHDRPARRRRK